MAKSAGAIGFEYKKNLQPGVSKPATLRAIIKNSEGPLTIGDAVNFDAGYVRRAPTATSVLGILSGFRLHDGENVFKSNQSHGATLSGDDTLSVASDNATRAIAVFAEVTVDKDALFLNKADSSLGQAEVGLYFDTTGASDQVTGTGNATQAQFQLIELVTRNGEGATVNDLGLFRIAESQLYSAKHA